INRVLITYIDEYYKAQQTSGSDWAMVESLFQAGAQAHSRSYLYPYFLLFQADALLKQDKKIDALGVMEKALAAASVKDPLQPLLKLKSALIKIDSDDAAIQ